MKNNYPLLLAFVIAGMALCNIANAQYVSIDPGFASTLVNDNGLGSCVNNNQLDTSCTLVLTIGTLYITDGASIEGIQYFKSLDSLICSYSGLTVIPALPHSLKYLDCDNSQQLDSIAPLPNTLVYLDCSHCSPSLNLPSPLPDSLQSLSGDGDSITITSLPAPLKYFSCQYCHAITTLPVLPGGLQYLDIEFDFNLTAMPLLPDSLINLSCGGNLLTSLPALPHALQTLSCWGNQLSVLPDLPANLTILDCHYNTLSSLPPLSGALTSLISNNNNLSSLPALPATLQYLNVRDNQLTSLALPCPNLLTLDCSNNPLNSLPSLSSQLYELTCDSDNLSILPALPVNDLWYVLSCNANQLTALPALPPSLQYIYCAGNNLNSLPALPPVLSALNCSNNPNLSCLPMLTQIQDLNFDTTAITCLPNYGSVSFSQPSLDSLPLCGLWNNGGCQPFWNISGMVYYDENNDCIFDSADLPQNNVKMELFNHDSLVQQTFTVYGGNYSFLVSPGTYTVRADTTQLPFKLSCHDTGYVVTITNTDSLSYNNDMAFTCRDTGFDLGVFCLNTGVVYPRPADTITLNAAAGDLSEVYAAHCAEGLSGQVQLVYSGPLHYTVPVANALTPTTISGDTLTWNIADFGTINDYTAFDMLFAVDSNAAAGTSVCFAMTVSTSTPGDYNPGNNTLSYCITVVNSLDPNEKEVYPTGLATAGEWLNYTVRFQNTGSAPAINIQVTDTLNPHLDPSTFQLLSSSAKNITQLFGNVVDFNFPGINLPDSASNEPLSHGYVQYKIQVRSPMPAGTIVTNKASVYFDLNPPVVTNTVQNCVPVYDSTSASITCGDSLNFGGIFYHQPGSYNDTLTAVSGCDSIVTLQLSVTGGDTINQFGGICAGDSINFYGIWIYSPGMYQTTLPGTPCDTTAILSLVVMDPIPPTRVSDTICANDSLLFNGIYEHAAGTYTAHYSSVNGCDSTVDLTLTVQPASQTVTPASIVCGDSIYFGGSYYHLSGTYGDTATNIDGCDSITTLQLTVTGGDTTYLNDTICSNDSLLFNGSYYNTGGTYTAQYNSVTNCDSTVILRLTVNAVYTTQINDTICANDSLLFNGTYYNSSGTYTARYSSVTGCDSTVVLLLTVNPVPQVSFTWDSLIAITTYNVDTNNLGYLFLHCGTNLPLRFPLSGGSPPGGHYAGQGVSNDSLFPNSLNYSADQPLYDTISYSFSDGFCSATVSAIIEATVCGALQTITPNHLFDLYPNPAGDYTMIAIDPSAIGSTMKLLDITGKELLTMQLTATPQRIPISTLAAGVYMVAVEAGGVTGVKLLVKTE